jgi:SAM-dependent methyltransferase
MAEWWESFFGGRWGDVQLEWGGATTDEEIDALEDRLGLRPGSHILDVPSGDGRIGRRLAARGYRVTGVDITDRFLDAGRRAAEVDRVEVRFVKADMRDLGFESEFDAAVNYWGSFGYFDEDGDRRFADVVARSLRRGGRFLIETHTLETVLPIFSEGTWQRVGEWFVLREQRYDHELARVDTEWTLIGPNGVRETADSSIRLYTYAELTSLLREVGFVSFDAYDTGSGEPFGLGADRLTLVATKPT